MRRIEATVLFLVSSLAATGCGTAPGAHDTDGVPCDGVSSCPEDAPPESVCLEHLAADQLDDGCGVFLIGLFLGDDANPGTKTKPVRSLARAVDLARIGRGRVFVCIDGFEGAITLPSGVDLIGGFNCLNWERGPEGALSILYVREGNDLALTIEPASAADTGAADGISRIVDMRISSRSPIGVFARANTVVEFVRSEIRSASALGGRWGEDGYNRAAPDGENGQVGADACAAETVAGAAAVTSPCDGGAPSIGGKGGDGYPGQGGAGDDGTPLPSPNPTFSGLGGDGGDGALRGCSSGRAGLSGQVGSNGAAGEGIGRITESGWEGGKAGDGGPGMPGQGGGGGGGLRGGLSLCGAASKGGPSGGSGGSGGCGGEGGKGGDNGGPSIGVLVFHAKVTFRDTEIETLRPGRGGRGGEPQRGGRSGRGAPGGLVPDRTAAACSGGEGGYGGYGGYGGGGRGGDSIGIAYVGDDAEIVGGDDVTFILGAPGEGGLSLSGDPTKSGAAGAAYETFRFPE